jgi:hypothetical protein
MDKMEEQNQIVAETINTSRFFIVFMSYLLGGTYLSFGIAAKFHSAIIAIIGLVVFAILPIALMGRIILFFTKKIKVAFFEDHILLVLLNLKNDTIISEKVLYYKELLSCTINSTRNKYSVIYFNLLESKKIKYTFKSLFEDKSKNLSELIYENIRLRDNDVILKPTFSASKQGTYYIIGLAVLMVTLMLLHLFYSPETSVFTFIISISLFVNILSKRKRDIDVFNRHTK